VAAPQLRAAHARQVEQVVDQAAHALHRSAHPNQIVLRFSLQRRPIVLEQKPAEAVDGPQRRPQVVGHGVRERFELLVGPLQLGRALLDAGLQLAGELTQFLLCLLALGDVADDGRQVLHLALPVAVTQDDLKFPTFLCKHISKHE
jgi:hypothetical protein